MFKGVCIFKYWHKNFEWVAVTGNYKINYSLETWFCIVWMNPLNKGLIPLQNKTQMGWWTTWHPSCPLHVCMCRRALHRAHSSEKSAFWKAFITKCAELVICSWNILLAFKKCWSTIFVQSTLQVSMLPGRIDLQNICEADLSAHVQVWQLRFVPCSYLICAAHLCISIYQPVDRNKIGA